MTPQTRVLLYGGDSLLLELGSVLTVFHHQVRYAKTFSDLVEVLPGATVDLVIFCASVSQQESARVRTFAFARWPQHKSLRLTTKALPDSSTMLSGLAPVMSTLGNIPA